MGFVVFIILAAMVVAMAFVTCCMECDPIEETMF